MTPLRLLRIVGFAAGFFVAFTVSQAATAARSGGETVPGIHYRHRRAVGFFSRRGLRDRADAGPRA